jgi:hypothetical protein
MKSDNEKIEKERAASRISSVVKKLKLIRNQVVFLDMRNHVRVIDKNIVDLVKLKRDLLRDE